MRIIWQTLIQPKMDYCSQLWCPGDQESISKLESVQRHFLSKVKGLEHLSYWERLSSMNLYSQERRRERYMVIFLWKISQDMVKGYSVPFTTSERRGRTIIPQRVVASARGGNNGVSWYPRLPLFCCEHCFDGTNAAILL